jgi:hypothetical protein
MRRIHGRIGLSNELGQEKKTKKKRKRLNFHEEAYVSPRNNAYVVYS